MPTFRTEMTRVMHCSGLSLDYGSDCLLDCLLFHGSGVTGGINLMLHVMGMLRLLETFFFAFLTGRRRLG